MYLLKQLGEQPKNVKIDRINTYDIYIELVQ